MIVTASAILIAVAYFVGFMRGQASGRRSVRAMAAVAESFMAQAKRDTEPEEAARMAECPSPSP